MGPMQGKTQPRSTAKKQAAAIILLAILTATALAGCMDEGAPKPYAGYTVIDHAVEGLESAQASETVRLEDGDQWNLSAGLVRHDPGTGKDVAMFAYNQQIPGPTIRAPQDANISVHFTNQLPYETTVHWHGVRLDVEFDGMPGNPHPAVRPGDSFTYQVRLPDEGLFWYHPHVREDLQVGLGLAGAIVVEGPRHETETWPDEHVVMINDIRLDDDGNIAPYYEEVVTHALLGRFGTRTLVNGGDRLEAQTAPGERVRLHLFNVANARPLSITFPGAERAEWIGSDGGFLREPQNVSYRVLGPSERITVDIIMPNEGSARVLQGAPGTAPFTIASLKVDTDLGAADDAGAPMGPHERAKAELAPFLDTPEADVETEWELDLELDLGMEMDHGAHAHHGHGSGGSIDWEDHDDPMNAMAHSDNTRWIIRDKPSGDENMDMNPTYPLDSLVRITITNLDTAEHVMQHPVHLHGQRFIVEALDGEPREPVWKDTVLVPGGSQAVILVDMSNPGKWMAHCHTTEHIGAGMKGMFTVA